MTEDLVISVGHDFNRWLPVWYTKMLFIKLSRNNVTEGVDIWTFTMSQNCNRCGIKIYLVKA